MVHVHRQWSLALCASLVLVGSSARAQSVDDIRWVPNGPVFAVVHHDGITYVGGQFSIVSPPSGAGVPINSVNGLIPAGFPYVIGRVFTVVGDGTGGWYLGGLFTSVGGQPRNNVAQLASDLSVTSWNPNANGAVSALQITTLGTVYAGGEFTSIGGQARNRLAELDASGNATVTNPDLNGNVLSLATSGSIMYVGGEFTFAGLVPRSRLAAIDVNTRTLTSWNPGCDGPVRALEVAFRPGISILIGGSFATVAGFARANLAEVLTSGNATTWNPSPNGAVRAIQEHTTDYIAGDFTSVAGTSRNHLAAISPGTGFASAWNPNVDGPVECLVWSAFNVFVGGTFQNVGGLPRRNLAKIDEVTGIAAAWDPQPNSTVKAIEPGGSGKVFAGGEFTGFGGVVRNNLAAFDDWSGGVTAWNPDANAPVRALALRVFGPTLYTVYAGGDFTLVGGHLRGRLAAIHPTTGVPTSWILSPNSTVYSLICDDSLVYFGGAFTQVDGSTWTKEVLRLGAARHDDASSSSVYPIGLFSNGAVFTLALRSNALFAGGTFTTSLGPVRTRLASFDLPARTQSDWNPVADAPVRALCTKSALLYAGGDFATVGGQPRARLAAFDINGTVTAWNPGADGIVRATVQGETGLIVGGDFLNAGSAQRSRLAQIDQTTGLAHEWIANAADREVMALAASGPYAYPGGTFRGVGGLPQAGFAQVGPPRVALCQPPPLASFAGGRPRALAVLDADGDGILDLAVCETSVNPRVHIMRGLGSSGVGNGAFTIGQTLNFTAPTMAVVAADFDLDGRPDLAVSSSDDVGTVSVFLNVNGSFEAGPVIPLPGRSDGLAAGDFDADGILDIVACLTDSASVIRRGGLQFLRGGGSGGAWDGTFVLAAKGPSVDGLARHILAQDFDQDGWTDFIFTGASSQGPYMIMIGPAFTPTCFVGISVVNPPGNSGVALAAGDFNEDGRTDIVSSAGRNLRVRYKNTNTGCSNWFPNAGSLTLPLPSTPRDLAVIDLDQDGILDVVCAFDSLNTLAVCHGLGTAGVGDGTFASPVAIAIHDVWAIVSGDFVTDGIADLVTSMATCGQVNVMPNGSSPLFPVTITLEAPNGGEQWSEAAMLPPPPPTDARVASDSEVESSSPPTEIASLQAISWSKGAGVHGVDVEISRNDGTTWRTIASNMPGTSMNWIVTPPGTALARVRVRDTAYVGRVDQSDAPFVVFADVVGTPPPGAPLRADLRLLGRHPAAGAARFTLDVPKAADIAVVLYDAAGRVVRKLARGTYPAGTHELAWDGRNAQGAACRRGVYFVRAEIGSFQATRKVVLL